MTISLNSKWIVYFLTLVSFALVHSIRSAWSSLKSMLHDPPFNMSAQYLGVLDMVTLFSLAITVTLLGSQVERFGSKRVLNLGIMIVAALCFIVGMFLLFGITSKFVYVLVYGLLIGIVSASGWPSCLSILSRKFDRKNNVALPLWNGTSQLGDFIALFISDLIIHGLNINGSITLLVIPLLMIIIVLLNIKFLPSDNLQQFEQQNNNNNDNNNPIILNEQKQPKQMQSYQNQDSDKPKQLQLQLQLQRKCSDKQLKDQGITQQIKDFQIKIQDQVNNQETNQVGQTFVPDSQNQPVNFMNVWLLPSVAGYVFAIALVKSVNSMLVAWFVYYLYELQMKSQARIIAILWSTFVFVGGALGGYFNPTYSKKKFIFSLTVSAIMFLFLEQLHLHINEAFMIIVVIICALFYGGPYNQMSTAIPLVLSEKPQIKNRPNSKSAIIAVIDGTSKLMNGLTLLIVPSLGVINMNWIGFSLCLISLIILAIEQFKQVASLKQLKHQEAAIESKNPINFKVKQVKQPIHNYN